MRRISGLAVVLATFVPSSAARALEAPAHPDPSEMTSTVDEPGRPDHGMAERASVERKPDEPGRSDRKDKKGEDVRSAQARDRKLTDEDIATAPIRERSVATRHALTLDGRSFAYTATAGTLTIRDDDGKPTASMFYVAYTAPGTRGGRRPVTFFYNGGPGSSTLWLHMGSLAPVRVRTDSPQATNGPPFELVANDQTLLDKSDLVFIDAIGTGFSRPLGDTKLAAFWGTDPDIDAFARGIERYLTVDDRWNAPKFIFGESYGATRSAGLSYRLQKDGVQLNGVILLSSILNYGRRAPGFDQEIINYVPSYAAIAAYHHKIAAPAGDLMAFLRQVREWARGPYAVALARGQDLSEPERQGVAQQLSAYTGLSTPFILDNDLRVEPGRFRKELLRHQRRTLGRYDARFEGIDVDAGGETPESDPSDTGISGAFVSSFHDYLSRELGWRSDMSYRPTYYTDKVQWDFKHKPPGARGPNQTNTADVALDLSAAMRDNPHLLVYSLNGLYDMATPFFGTEYDVAHMQLDPTLRPNLRFAYYPSGHMVYLNTEAVRTMKTDLAHFYDEAAH